MSLKKLGAAFVVVLLMVVAAPKAASASTIGFTCLTNNNNCSTIDQFFTGTVTVSGAQMTVSIFNTGSDGVIGQVYVDVPDPVTGYSFNSITGGPGTSYQQGATPPNVPGWNDANPDFDADFKFSATNPGPANGALDGEYFRVVFNLLEGQTQSDIDDLLDDGGIRFALHVQSLGLDGRYSEGLISTFVQVNQQCTDGTCATTPEPASMLLLGTGLLAVARMRRKKTS